MAHTARRLMAGAASVLGFAVLSGGWQPAATAATTAVDAARAPGRALNFLVIGTDGRGGITAHERQAYRLGGQACECSDTNMLVHVSEDRTWVSVVSVPRDILTELPEHTDRRTGEYHPPHPAKINQGFAEGGGDLAVRVFEQHTGVPLDGYLDVDFPRFMKAVDTAGGVSVCTRRDLKDPSTALDLRPGTHRLNGGEALQFVRSRKVDGQADFGRIQRQQQFLVTLLKELKSGTSWKSVKKLTAVAEALGPNGDASEKRIGTGELLALAASLKELKPGAIHFATMPVRGFNPLRDDVGSTLQTDEQRAAIVFDTFRNDVPLTRATASMPDTPAPPAPIPHKFVTYSGSQLGCGPR